MPDPPSLLPPASVPPPMKRPAAASSPPLLSHKTPVAAVEGPSAPQVLSFLIQSQTEAVVPPALRVRKWGKAVTEPWISAGACLCILGVRGVWDFVSLWDPAERGIFLCESVDCILTMAGKRLGRLVLDRGSLNHPGYKHSASYVGEERAGMWDWKGRKDAFYFRFSQLPGMGPFSVSCRTWGIDKSLPQL